LHLCVRIMKIRLILSGKTEEEFLKSGIREYEIRVKRYIPFEIVEIPALKNAANLSHAEQKSRESVLINKRFLPGDVIILLDENGKEMSSTEFASFLHRQFLSGSKNLVFVVGGAFGFDPSLKNKASAILSLSRMTFSHQMVRLFFIEQLYRGLTILRGESYHHP
jgi:23S rRNA (pseudouridine1915-N3)-methyltransferase